MSMYSVWSWEGKHIATGSVMTYEEYDKFEDMIEAILSDFWDQGGESESNHAVEDMTAAAREFTKNNPDIILRLNYECTDDGNEFADFYFENGEEESCWASIEYPKPKKIVWPEKEPESNYCVDVGIRRFYKIYVTAESKAEAETNATKIALESDHEELILDPELDTENEDVEICGVYEMQVTQTENKTTFNLGIPTSNLAYATFEVDPQDGCQYMESPDGWSDVTFSLSEDGELQIIL